MKNYFILFFSLFFLKGNAQGPWTQEKGKIYTQASFSTIPNYSNVYGNPDYTVSGKINDNTFQFYGEYGISNKTTLIINIPYKVINRSGFDEPTIICITSPCGVFSNKKVSEFGNIEIGIKHNFSNKNWLISSQFSTEMNTSSFDNISGIRTGYNAWSFTPLFLIGKSNINSYLQLFTGFTFRTNNYSSNFKIGGEYGWKLGEKIWFATFIDIVKSLKNGNIQIPFSNITSALYVNNQEFGGFGFKGIYNFSSSFGLTAGLGGAFFANNVAKQAALNIGLYQKF